MANPIARGALETQAHLKDIDYTAFKAEERAITGKINLRGKSDDRAFAAAAARGLGDLFLPMEPTSSTARDDLAVLWLGPDEWMITCPQEKSESTLSALEEALSGVHHSAVEVSDNFTVFRVSGTGVRRALSKLGTLDFHPRGFRPGDVVQTPLGKADTILHLVEGDDDAITVDVYVRRSFAAYVWMAMDNAAIEFGVAV